MMENIYELCNILESLDSPQVKQRLIPSIKDIVYNLTHKLPNVEYYILKPGRDRH